MGSIARYGRTLATAAVLAVWAALSTAAFAEDIEEALVPFKVNANAEIVAVTVTDAGRIVYSDYLNVTAGEQAVLNIPLKKTTGVINAAQKGRSNKPATINYRAGKVSLHLSARSYKDAEISLYSLSGKRILHGKASAYSASNSISRRNVAAGVYLLRVKGVDGSAAAARLTHRSGSLDISVVFADENAASTARMAKSAADTVEAGSAWYIRIRTALINGKSEFLDSIYKFTPAIGTNELQDITLRPTPATGGPYNLLMVLGIGMNTAGSGTYAAGATVNVSAGPAPAGLEFRQWFSLDLFGPGVDFAQEKNPATSFVMPSTSYSRIITIGALFVGPPKAGDGRLIGDWQSYSQKRLDTDEITYPDPENDGIEILSIRQPWTAIFTYFNKTEDYWVESAVDYGDLLSADGSYLYLILPIATLEEFKIPYRVSGDEFVITVTQSDYETNDSGEETYIEYDVETTYKRVNLDDVRSSLNIPDAAGRSKRPAAGVKLRRSLRLHR